MNQDNLFQKIASFKANPKNVPVFSEAGNYYVLGSDVESYMEYASITDATQAMNNIAKSLLSEGADVTPDNLIVMGSINSCDISSRLIECGVLFESVKGDQKHAKRVLNYYIQCEEKESGSWLKNYTTSVNNIYNGIKDKLDSGKKLKMMSAKKQIPNQIKSLDYEIDLCSIATGLLAESDYKNKAKAKVDFNKAISVTKKVIADLKKLQYQ